MPVLVRFLQREQLPPNSQVFLRYIFAFLFALIYYFLVTKTKLKVYKKSIVFLLIISIVGYTVTNLFFTYAVLNGQVATTLFLFYCYSIITPVLGFFVLKEKMNKYVIIALGIILAALLLLFQPISLSSLKVGALFAIISSFGQSIYLVGRKKLTEYPAKFMTLANTFIGVIVVGILSLVFENKFYSSGAVTHLSLQTWIVTILFGSFNFLGWLCMTKGFEYFKSSLGSIILMLELVFGVILAFLFFNEIPTLYTLLGGVLIVIASLLVILKGD
jgi:drug/metabolite transporter (DMT)-like permease